MDFVGIVEKLGSALWELKGMYDQHKVNTSEAKVLDEFIHDLQQCSSALAKQFQGATNRLANVMLEKLATDINEAIDMLDEWLANRSFFRILNAHDRKQELEKMHVKVMSSIQKNLTIASLSILLDVHASQATIIEQGTEMKSLLISNIESKQGALLPKVRAEVVQARQSAFGDDKFWQEVLAAIDSRHEASGSRVQDDLYEDPITAELMIDPVVASNDNTYCRWTIIENDIMTKDPHNPEEDMTIVADNLTLRRGLFGAFPEQYAKFQQRRHEYRCNALSLASMELLGDAEVALQNVLQWDKKDKECAQILVQVRGALKAAKGKCAQRSSVSMYQTSNSSIKPFKIMPTKREPTVHAFYENIERPSEKRNSVNPLRANTNEVYIPSASCARELGQIVTTRAPAQDHRYPFRWHNGVEFFVPQCCVVECQKEIENCLYCIGGVDQVVVDYNNQKVSVRGIAKPDRILRGLDEIKNGSRLYDYAQDFKGKP